MEKNPQEDCLVWIHDHKNQIERARYGNNKRAIREAIEDVENKKKVIDDYRATLEKVLKGTRDDEKKAQLREAYDGLQEAVDKKLACLQTMVEITSLEEHCGNLHRIMDSSAVSLVRLDQREEGGEMPGQNNPGFVAPSSQDCIFAVQDNWEWVVKLVKCIDLHLKNGATYHKFFHEIDESQHWLNEDLKRLHDSFELKPLEGDLKDASKLLQELKELAVSLKQWEVKVNRFWDTATKVVPVHIRVNGTDDPVPARILADYETSEIRLREGEEVLLVENADPNMWKIRNCRGEEVMVPALIVLIPGPDKHAIDAAVKMKLQLLTAWTNTLKRIGKRLLCFMLMVFKPDYTTEEINLMKSIQPLDKQDLMRILDHIEDSLKVHWSDHEGFLTLQERVLQLRMILEEGGDEVLQDPEKYKALVVQITMLEKLMDNYKDLWKDWEKYKVALEASRSPELMLVVDKWEQLQFVTRDDFANFDEKDKGTKDQTLNRSEAARRFWQSELPFDEVEKKLSGLRELAANESRIGMNISLGDESIEETIHMDTATAVGSAASGESFNLASFEDTQDLLSGTGSVTVTKIGGGAIHAGRPRMDNVTTTTRRVQEETLPAAHRIEDTTNGEGFDETRTVTSTVRTVQEQDMHPREGVDGFSEDGFEDSRVVTQTVRTVESGRPNLQNAGSVTTTTRRVQEGTTPAMQSVEESSSDGFDDTRTVTSTVRTVQEVHGTGMPAMESLDGFNEEGFEDSRTVTQTVTVEGEMGRARPTDVGSQEGGFSETRTTETRYGMTGSGRGPGDSGSGGVGMSEIRQVKESKIRSPLGSVEMETTDEGLFEEGVHEQKIDYEQSRARVGSTESSNFGMATETKTAETEQLNSTEVEEKKTFVIRSVVNPEDQSEVSLQQAIMAGIICPKEGIYFNKATGEKTPIPLAMGAGLIRVEFTTVRRSPEKKSSIGLITVKTIREQARPYFITAVKDTVTGKDLEQHEAAEQGILDEKRGSFFDRKRAQRMLLSEAIEKGLMIVEYDGEAPEPQVISQMYAVRAVVDRRLKKVISFHDAVRRGIIDKESGFYKDTLTGDKMYVGDAIMRGFLKARAIEDTKTMEIDPINQMLVDKTEKIHKKLIQPLQVISAFKKAASLAKK